MSKGSIKYSVVRIQAMRLARNLVKEGIRDAGRKISDVDAKEITRAASKLVVENPEIRREALLQIAKQQGWLS